MIVKGNHGFKPLGLHYHANRRFPFPSCIIQKQLLFSNIPQKSHYRQAHAQTDGSILFCLLDTGVIICGIMDFCSILNKSAPASSEITFATFSVLPTVK